MAEEAPAADDNGSKSPTVRGGKNGDKEKKGKVSIESLQLALDAGGMIPVVGIAFDIASAGISAYRGNWGEAAMSLVGAVPGFGDALKGAWLAAKLGKVAKKADAAQQAVTGAVRYRVGEAVQPMEKTMDMALNPELYAYAVCKRHGINLRGSGKQITLQFDPTMAPGKLGSNGELTPTIIKFGPASLTSEATLANTIAHELNHARSWLKGGRAPEKPAYAAGDALEDYIMGRR